MPIAELMWAVKKHQLEGIVGKHTGSPCPLQGALRRLGEMAANRKQEFVIGGNIPDGDILDSLLVGYFDGRDLMYAASVGAGIPQEFRRVFLSHLEALQIPRCPFANLPDRGEGRLGDGVTAAKMAMCRWLDPFIVSRIEFLEWTPDNRLRHPRFAGIRSDKGFEFIEDDALRDNLRLDLSDAASALRNNEWKAATVLSASVIEALLQAKALLDELSR